MALIQGQKLVATTQGADHEDVDTTKEARKAKDWLDRAKLVVAAARKRAARTARRYAARRLAETLCAKS
jgi:hypothetical protein